MQVTYGLDRDLPDLERAITVGAFDGLHMGHQYLIRRTHAEAATRGLESAVMTFEPIPHEFFAESEDERLRLTTREERIDILSHIGIDRVIIAEFNREFASIRAKTFARDILADRLNVRVLVAAQNHHMGAGAEADVDDIRQLGSEFGFDVVVAPLLSLDGVRVSSTQIRRLLAEGNVSEAAALLGRCYCLGGTVVTGRGRGHELGYPTANLNPPENKIIPADGVYAAFACADGSGCDLDNRSPHLPAAVSIGPQPTFDDPQRTVEAFICTDEDLDLVGSQMCLRFIRRLRDIRDFDSREALTEQIRRDVKTVRRFLGG